MNGINIVNLTCPDCFHPVRVHGLQTRCISPDCECKHTYAGAGMLALQPRAEAARIGIARNAEITDRDALARRLLVGMEI